VATKDTVSNWWKQVIKRRKVQKAPEELPPEDEAPQAEETEVPSGESTPPSSESPPETPGLEEQIDQVIISAAPSQAETPSVESASEALLFRSGIPPKARKGHSIWPPPPEEKIGEAEPEPEPKPPEGRIEQGVDDQPREPEPPPAREGDPSPVTPGPVPPRRGGRLPEDLLAYLILFDIGGEMRQARKIPQYFQLWRRSTLAGRHAKAHIHLDDEATVRPEHAKILCQERDGRWSFTLYPLSSEGVKVNEKPVDEGGVVLTNGDVVSIGSAKLVFFMKNLKDKDS